MNALLSVAIFFAQHAIYGPWVRECNALWTWEMMISPLLLLSFIRLSFSVLQKLEKKGNNLLHSNHFAICTLQRAKNEATSSIFCEPRADLVIALQVCDLVPNVSGRMRAWEPTFIPQMSLPVPMNKPAQRETALKLKESVVVNANCLFPGQSPHCIFHCLENCMHI